MEKTQISLIHDGLVVSGGAERVAAALMRIFPASPLYTSAWLPENTYPYFKKNPPKQMWASKMVQNEMAFKALYPLWWLGFRNLDLSGSDLVISSSSYLSKYVRPPDGVPHICYLHNPFRYLWDPDSYKDEKLPFPGSYSFVAKAILPLLRRLDQHYTDQITQIITNSNYMAGRIKIIYGRDTEVVYPPISIADFPLSENRQDFYLFAGRLKSYKRADLAVQACRHTGRKLVIAGTGPEEKKLQGLGAGIVTFMGKVSDSQLKQLYSRARALLVPGCEDFGLVPVEAQATGCPVIAFHEGGVSESILSDKTGLLFQEQSVESLETAIQKFEKMKLDAREIRQNVLRFDIENFKKNIYEIVNRFLPAGKHIQ